MNEQPEGIKSTFGEVYICDSDFICEAYFTNENQQIPEGVTSEERETVPCSIMQIQSIQGRVITQPLIVLFNPGSTHLYMRQNVVPQGRRK